MTKEFFISTLATMMKIYNHTIDKEATSIYWELLKNISDSDFKKMVENIFKNFKPTQNCQFPVPSDFLTLYTQRPKDIVRYTIDSIDKYGSYNDVNLKDGALHATIERFGGWVELCKWTYKDWDYKAREFKECYEGCLISGINGSEILYGQISIENNKKCIETKKIKAIENKSDLERIDFNF